MIFNSLKLKNFGPFFGEHEILLNSQPNKPIILFGAFNGSGKTTIFNGIQLALFGKYIKAVGKYRGRYDKYLRSLINRDTDSNELTSIQLSFQINENSISQEISIKREWFFDKSVKEKCEIYINGILDENNSQRSYEYIQQIISPELSNLFFFDGEKIEALADPSKSKHIIAQGINDLLGVNTIDRLVKSLYLLERKKALKLSEKQDDISLIEEQQKIEILTKNIKAVGNKIDDTQILITEKEAEAIDHSKLMNSSGAELFKERDKFKSDLSLLISKKEIIKNKIHDLIAGDLPLVLVSNQIANIRSDSEKQSHYSENTIEVIKDEITRFSEHEKINFSNNKREEVLKDFFSSLEIINNKHPHIIDNLIIPGEEFIAKLKNDALSAQDELVAIDNDIEQVEKKLNAIPEDGKVKEILAKETKITNELLELKVKLNLYNSELLELEKQSESTNKILDQKIQTISENESINYIDRKVIQTSQKSRETLKTYKQNLIKKHVQKINEQVGLCFAKIYRKSKIKISFSINPEDFSISMQDGEKEIGIDILSSGERQLLAISILWALSIIAAKKMPILIDTPLARLDSKHRTSLLKEYFPKCSHQMLIFSTDEEVDQKYYPIIQNKISHQYLINYDENIKQSFVLKGYFDEVINQ